MNRTIRARWLLVACVLVAGLSVTPPAWAKPLSDAQCISYRGLSAAPKGKIPRDDLHSVRVDPVSRWADRHPAAADAAVDEVPVDVS